MGYHSQIRGTLTFIPTLKWSEFRGTKFATPKAAREADTVLMLTVGETSEETDEGVRIVKSAHGIESTYEEEIKAYSIEKDFAEIVALVGPDRSVSGELLVIGEEQGDVRRLRIVDGKPVIDKAELRWPDGTLVTGHGL